MSKFKRAAFAALALLLASVGTALAQPQKVTIPVDGMTVANVCSDLPDLVTLSGGVDVTVNAKPGKGGTVSGKVSFNAGGVKGAGLWGKYTGNGTGEFSFKVKDPYPAHVTGPGHFFLLLPGSNNDLKVSFLLHLNVQGNGSFSDPQIEIRQLDCGDFGL